FLGQIAFNQGNFAYRFQETSGIDRPVVRYAGTNMLSYAEWSSTASIDGDVQELWNNNHGYDVDQHNPQVYSTISGIGWQLSEMVNLVNDHTVTVTFNFVARPDPHLQSVPVHYVFDIAHIIPPPNEWYNIQTDNNSFTAQVIQGNGAPDLTRKLISYGTLSFAASGPALQTPAINVKNSTSINGSTGAVTLAQAFDTEYQVTNPTPFKLITLGTETLTFKPDSTPPDAPSQDVVPLPGGTTPAGH
ncbi:MAG: hypothetical protein ABI413_08015, partial [Ktedonobacteraceae bacterium]